MSAIEPLADWTSVQCSDGNCHACRPTEWGCTHPCHERALAAVVSGDDPALTDRPASPTGSSSDTASDAAVASTTDPVAGAEPPPATVHGAASVVDGAADVRVPPVTEVVGPVGTHTRDVARGSTS